MCSIPFATASQRALQYGSCRVSWQESGTNKGYWCSFLCVVVISGDLLHICSEHEDSWVSKAVKYFALRGVNMG